MSSGSFYKQRDQLSRWIRGWIFGFRKNEKRKRNTSVFDIHGHIRAGTGGTRAAGAKRDRLGNAVRETNAISRLTAMAEFQWSR